MREDEGKERRKELNIWGSFNEREGERMRKKMKI
jgi:hypothetical protein